MAGSGAASAAALLAALVGWSALTEIDVVTTAPAVARVLDGTATVRSPATRTVAQTPLAEGARVQRGALIARLESTLANVRWRSAQQVVAARQRALDEARTLLARLESGTVQRFLTPSVRLRLETQRQRLAQLDGEIDVLRTELLHARGHAVTAERLARLAADRYQSVQHAGEVGALSRFDVQAAAQALWSRNAELDTARSRIAVLARRLSVGRHARAAAQLAFREALLGRIDSLEVEVADSTARLADAAEQRRLSDIVAPVAGVLDRLLVGAGDFVERGEPVAIVVPEPGAVFFEARLAPAQMGFLRAGLPCRLKLDALPFPRYGALACTLTRLASDVVGGEQGPGHYLARIEPAAQVLVADGVPIRLRAGASARVDVVAGRRTVLGYVTEPLQRFTRESLREF